MPGINIGSALAWLLRGKICPIQKEKTMTRAEFIYKFNENYKAGKHDFNIRLATQEEQNDTHNNDGICSYNVRTNERGGTTLDAHETAKLG